MSDEWKTWGFILALLALGLGLFAWGAYLDHGLNKECEEKGGVRVRSGSYSSTCIKAQKIE